MINALKKKSDPNQNNKEFADRKENEVMEMVSQKMNSGPQCGDERFFHYTGKYKLSLLIIHTHFFWQILLDYLVEYPIFSIT